MGTSVQMFIAALCVIAPNWKPPQEVMFEQWWFVDIVECDSAAKRSEHIWKHPFQMRRLNEISSKLKQFKRKLCLRSSHRRIFERKYSQLIIKL